MNDVKKGKTKTDFAVIYKGRTVYRVLLKIKCVDTSRDHQPPRSLNLKSAGTVSTRMLNTNGERLPRILLPSS